MTTINLPFAIGALVWVPVFETRKERVTCCECGGSLVVRVVTYDDRMHSVKCEHCTLDGWTPHGYTLNETGSYKPRQVKLTLLVRYEDSRAEYRIEGDDTSTSSWTSYYSDAMYADLADCEAECAKRNAKAEKDEHERVLRSLANSRSKAVRTVVWTKRKIAELKKQLAHAVKKLNEFAAKESA